MKRFFQALIFCFAGTVLSGAGETAGIGPESPDASGTPAEKPVPAAGTDSGENFLTDDFIWGLVEMYAGNTGTLKDGIFDFIGRDSGFYLSAEPVQVSLLAGFQGGLVYKFDNNVRASAGVMAGFDFREVSEDLRSRDWLESFDYRVPDLNDIGTFYGAYFRVDTRISRRWSIITAYRYLNSTNDEEIMFNRDGYRSRDDSGLNMITIGAAFEF